jgi:hypothetical protein
MVGWRNNFGTIESGDGDIDFISLRLAHESQRASACRTEGADPRGAFNFTRPTFRELKIIPPKRSPCRKRRSGTLATIFAMTMRDVVGQTGAFVSNGPAQATAANGR